MGFKMLVVIAITATVAAVLWAAAFTALLFSRRALEARS